MPIGDEVWMEPVSDQDRAAIVELAELLLARLSRTTGEAHGD